MNKTKKLLTVLLLIVVALSIIPLSISNAAGNATVAIEAKEITQGGQTTIAMTLAGSVSAEDFTARMKFDNTKLEVVKVAEGDILGDSAIYTGISFEEDEAVKKEEEETGLANANKSGEIIATVAAARKKTYKAGTVMTVTFKVKAGVAGTQNITAQVDIDGESNVIPVTAGSITVSAPITGIKLDKTTSSVNVGATTTLVATVEPANATGNKTVTWESSDTTVATVANGVVKGIKEGKATITAKVANGAFSATCEVTVACAHEKVTTHPAVAPTCTTEGNTEYKTCDACGKIVEGKNEKIPMIDHTYVSKAEVPVVHTATELKDGTKAHFECSVCHKLFDEAKKETTAEALVIKAAHSFVVDEKDEIKHKATCKECGKTVEEEHHGGKATCSEKAKCEVCGVEYGELDPDTHSNLELRNDVEATTEKEGYTGDVYCKDCGKLVEKGEVIAKLEKEPSKEENQDPTKPNTADNSHIVLWGSLVVITLAGTVYVIKHNAKKEMN